MRWIALLALSIIALVCFVAGTAWVLSATAAGSRVETVAPGDPAGSFMLQQDQPHEDLKIQVSAVRHGHWYSTRGWVVLGPVLVFAVVGLWLALAARVRVPESH
jgi:hypothetical protein